MVFKKKRNNHIYNTLFAVIFFVIGVLSSYHSNSSRQPTYFFDELDLFYLVQIEDPPIEKINSFQILVSVLQNETKLSTGKALLYLKKSNLSAELKHGDKLIIRNKFNPILGNNNPFEFDYKRYLKIHNIHHQAYLIDHEWKYKSNTNTGIYSMILSLRKKLDGWLSNSMLSTRNKKVAKALFLGEKEFLDDSILKSFSSAGAMHVLAVSGLHVGIIMLILQFVCKPVKKIKNGNLIYTTIVISGVWFYALITGFSPSVIRAALMFSFIVFGMGLQRQNSIYQSIFVSAFLILIFNPFSLFKVGFQLSYLAVLGIVYFQPKIYKTLYFKYKIADYLWQITSVSIAAQIATFPLGLYYFHQFPNLFLISNIIVIPLAGILLSLGFIYFILHFISPVKVILEYLLDIAFSFLNSSVAWIEKIPNSILWGISIHWAEVIFIYALIASITFGFVKRSKRFIFLSLIGASLFLGLQFYEQHKISNQLQLVCYNIRKDFALDIFNGTENTFISTASIAEDESKLLFHIKHNWFHNRGNKAPAQNVNIESVENIIVRLGENKNLSIINSYKKPLPVTQYVILYQIDYLSPMALDAWIKNKTILILHPDLKRQVKHFCKENYPGALLYDIRKNGAFQLNYK